MSRVRLISPQTLQGDSQEAFPPAPPCEPANRCQVAALNGVKAEAERLLASTQPRDASAGVRLKAFLAGFQSDDKVLIIISADPDAIASAVTVKRLLWRRVGQIVVASTNNIKRPDNLQLLETLKLKMEPLSGVDVGSFSRLVMVDSQPHHSPQTERLAFDVIIDHHPPSPVRRDVARPSFVDLRPESGATATMMTGYLKAAKIKPSQKLATALFYAIKTDTQNFVRQGQLEDMKAFRWLYPFINPQLLSDIELAPIARSSFRNIVEGLSGVIFKKNMAYTFLQNADHADTLVIVADFLMKIKGISCSVAAGICGPDKLVVIFRAGGRRQNVGVMAARAFGEFGSAGGHKNMARAEIPLKNLDPKTRSGPGAVKRFIWRRLSGDKA